MLTNLLVTWHCCPAGKRDDGRSHASILAYEADAYASFKRKTMLKLAKAVTERFTDACSAYRRKKGLEVFAATTYDGRQASCPAACPAHGSN